MIYESEKNQQRECIKSKEFAFVTFKFKQFPEYIEPYLIFAFRSGLVHGVGVVLDVIPLYKDLDARVDPQKAKQMVRKFIK
jgi:hypothetical protein